MPSSAVPAMSAVSTAIREAFAHFCAAFFSHPAFSQLRYKLQLDPTVDDVRKLCLSCRRNAKGERVLVHFNGHGVPRPTANGEIWLFNKSYTQYIPLSIFDLQAWTGSPSIYVLDCSSAGAIVSAYNQYAETRGPEASVTFADGCASQLWAAAVARLNFSDKRKFSQLPTAACWSGGARPRLQTHRPAAPLPPLTSPRSMRSLF